MGVIASIFGFILAFFGVKALFRLPRFWNREKGRYNIRKWLLSGTCKTFFNILLVAVVLFCITGIGEDLEMVANAVLFPGALCGGAISLVLSGYGLLKYQGKNEQEFVQRKEDRVNAKAKGVLNQIRITRIQIQEEIKMKTQEARRMENDAYLKPEAKAQIRARYADCISLLQELYAEASNVLAYLETNGSDFRIDFDTLYISEKKQNDLQAQVDRLKAFHQLDMRSADLNVEELMKKYDADFQKIRSEEARAMRQMG